MARNYLSDILEFLSDVHTLSKVKSNVKGTVGLNEDTLGGTLKASLAQYLALEISKGKNILIKFSISRHFFQCNTFNF